PEPGERLGVGIVAVHVAQARQQAVHRLRAVDAAVRLDRIPGSLAQLLHAPGAARNPDHGDVEGAPPGHRVEGGEDLLVREISGRAEEDERVGAGGVGCGHDQALRFSSWPPNCLRMADSSWSSYSA